MQVRATLPEHLRPDAAQLYWQAFGGKLGRVMGPDRLALAYLRRVIRADHCLYCMSEQGALLGIAGFKSPAGSFVAGEYADMRAIYGVFGARWRVMLMRQLQTGIDNQRFLIDGISVHPDHRSKGIGARLIKALLHEAGNRGYATVRLEVVDRNLRARALYERLGFMPFKTERLGLLRYVFGFNRTTTMLYDLPDAATPQTETRDI